MLHKKTTWSICPAASAEDLARKLTEHTWTYDTGFELDGYLFLNDSTGPDGAQEYAVVKKPQKDGERFLQVESLTVSWMRNKLESIIKEAIAGNYDHREWARLCGESEPKLKPAFVSIDKYVRYLKSQNPIPLPPREKIDEEMLARVSVPGQIAEVTEETYGFYLDILPPRWMNGSTFCYAEGMEPYRLFWRDNDNRHFIRQLGWTETGYFLDIARNPIREPELRSAVEVQANHTTEQAQASGDIAKEKKPESPHDTEPLIAETHRENPASKHNFDSLERLLAGEDRLRVEVEGNPPLTVTKDPRVPTWLYCRYGDPGSAARRFMFHLFPVHQSAVAEYYEANSGHLDPWEQGDLRRNPQIQKELDAAAAAFWAELEEKGYFQRAQELWDRKAESVETTAPEAAVDSEKQLNDTKGTAMSKATDRAGIVCAGLLIGSAVYQNRKAAWENVLYAAPAPEQEIPNFELPVTYTNQEQTTGVKDRDGDTAPEAAVAPRNDTNQESGENMKDQKDRGNGERESGINNKPLHKLESGVCRAFIWHNGADRELTATFARIYKHQHTGEWRYSQSFRQKDLEDLAKLSKDAAHAIEHAREQTANRLGAENVQARGSGNDQERDQ